MPQDPENKVGVTLKHPVFKTFKRLKKFLWEKKKIEDLKVMEDLNLKSIINKPILLIPTQGTHVADSELSGLVYILSFSRS